KMNSVDVVAFDKTGTLTHGRLEVSDVLSVDSTFTADELLALTASAEALSEHPLGKAITVYARKNNVTLSEAVDFRMEAGKGISAQVGGKLLSCGSEKYLCEKGIELTGETSSRLEAFRSEGKASVITAVDGKVVGVIALSDVLRENAAEMTSELASAGVDTVLLTGDNRRTAAYFAEQAGISQVRAELLPEEKVSSIVEIQSKGRNVCMIGDGVNDAPALKTACVGVAMGGMGSDIAVEAADIALMSDDISCIPYLKRLSKATVNTIRFSISLSLLINFAAIILSVLELLNPTTGALVHNVGSVFVVLIAALLYDRKLK
ncbi:MAG: cation-translocating P-type ATPase, partial [Oscillospiraceae bacterium]|nr:cation-translocating P-type ATPase [Oscillospiraceae bacterium]